MKYLLSVLLMLPLAAAGQTQTDYEQMMAKFMRYYNNSQRDSVCILLTGNKPDEECLWEAKRGKSELLDKYGKILYYKYLGLDKTDAEPVRVFKVRFSKKGTKAMSFTLDTAAPSEYSFGTFRFDTSSEEIDRMLRQTK